MSIGSGVFDPWCLNIGVFHWQGELPLQQFCTTVQTVIKQSVQWSLATHSERRDSNSLIGPRVLVGNAVRQGWGRWHVSAGYRLESLHYHHPSAMCECRHQQVILVLNSDLSSLTMLRVSLSFSLEPVKSEGYGTQLAPTSHVHIKTMW